MSDRLKSSRPLAEGEAPMSAGKMLAILGQIYVVVLFVLIVGLANVDISGLIGAMVVPQLADPAIATNFTA